MIFAVKMFFTYTAVYELGNSGKILFTSIKKIYVVHCIILIASYMFLNVTIKEKERDWCISLLSAKYFISPFNFIISLNITNSILMILL